MEGSHNRRKNEVLAVLLMIVGFGIFSLRACAAPNPTTSNTNTALSTTTIWQVQEGDEPRAAKITKNYRSQKSSKASRNPTSTRTASNEILSEVECSGQKIVLENARVLSSETVGSENVCEIILPALSYIKIEGHVKLIAKNILLYGVVNGNALKRTKDAATLDIKASKRTHLSGSVELRGNFELQDSKGGELIIKSKNAEVSAQINLQGARRELNGKASFECTSCLIQHQNILYSSQSYGEISIGEDAEEIMQLSSNIRLFRENLRKSHSSETITFSYFQKVQLLKSRIKKFEARIEKNLNEELKVLADKNNLDPNSFLRSSIASKLFQEKAFSYNEKTDDALAFIKDFEIFTLSKKLKSVDNFDPHAWGLNADESYQLESKVIEIKNRTQEIYDTQAT